MKTRLARDQRRRPPQGHVGRIEGRADRRRQDVRHRRDGGHVFRIRRVDVGPETDGRVRILGGITPGEKIVTEGAIFMKREIESQ